MPRPRNKNNNKKINNFNNINLNDLDYINNSLNCCNNTKYDSIYAEFNYNAFIYFLFLISCLINIIFLTRNKKNRIVNIKQQKNVLIQTEPQMVSVLINPDNNIQIVNCDNFRFS